MLKKDCVLALMIGAIVFAGCDTIRSMVSDKNILGRYHMAALKDRKFDQLAVSMDKLYRRRVKETNKKKPHVIGQCIMHEVEKAAPNESYSGYGDWSNMVSSETEISAVTFGGRSLIISEGMLEKLNYQQDLIAFYIAHTIAHDFLHHTNEWLFKVEKSDEVGDLLEAWVNNTANFQSLAMSVNGSPLTEDSLKSYSVEMDDEADTIALNIIAYAGFNPNNAVALLSRHIGDTSERFYRIHPMTQERFEKLAARLENVSSVKSLAVKRNHVPQCENLQ